MKIKLKDYSNPISPLWENPKSWMQILKTQICFHSFTKVSNCYQTLRVYSNLFKNSKSLLKHLKKESIQLENI